MKTLAIDFETANEERGSACAIGLAWIENGSVLKQEERLIRPREMRFNSLNIAIHGIRPEDVESQPEFPAILSEYVTDLSGGLILAHNAAFDIGVMRATLDKYDLPYPTFTYLCTAKISRQVWPDLTTVSLPEVAHRLGIQFEHHKAAADAFACAEIALAAARLLCVSEISDIPSRIWLRPGKLDADGYSPCSIKDTSANAKPSRVIPTSFDWDEGHPLFSRSIVFTGGLRLMTRLEAAQLVVNLGGIVQDVVKKDTNFLVIAGDDYAAALSFGKMSNKTKKAKEMMAEGLPIEILSEDEFYRLCL